MMDKTVLTEALRLGSAGYREVLKNSQYIKLGIEYEFNVDEGVSAVEQATNFAVGSESESNLNKFALSQAENISMLMNFESDIDDMISELPSSYNDLDKAEIYTSFYYDDLVEMFDAFAAIMKSYNELRLSALDIPPKIYQGFGVPSNRYRFTMVDFEPEELVDNLNDVKMTLAAIDDYLQKDCRNLGLNPDISEVINAISQQVQKHRDTSGSGVMAKSKVDFVEETLPVNRSEIEGIVADPTVYNGAEVITKPLSLKRSLQLMEEMFKYIKEVGSTDSSTGLHVNVSVDGFDRSNFNAVKAVTLLDPDAYQSARKYPMRDKNMLSSLYQILDDERILAGLAKAYIAGGDNALRLTFEKLVIQSSNKFRNVNLVHFFQEDVSVNQRRLEFRFIGGNDYEHRYNEMVNDIFHICYVMIAGARKDAFRKEYLQSILRILDRSTRKATDNQVKYFSELVDFIRQQM